MGAAQIAAAVIGIGISISSGFGLLAAIWLLIIPAVLLALLWLARRAPDLRLVVPPCRSSSPLSRFRSTDAKVEHRPPIA